jgi:hypothetical protein
MHFADSMSITNREAILPDLPFAFFQHCVELIVRTRTHGNDE